MKTAPLPALSEPYPLAPERIAAYRRDGHVLLRGVASRDEVAAFHPILSRLVDENRHRAINLGQPETYRRAFTQIENLWRRDEQAKAFTLSRRFGRIAAELMGAPAVRIYHDQALFKEAGGGHTPWHQDQHYWPLKTDRTVTLWMPLVDVTVDMGAFTFASGSHTEGYFGDMEISDASERILGEMVAKRGFPVVRSAMAAGDATFHSGWTLHSAPPNTTATRRDVMTIIYFPDGTRLMEPDNEGRKADLKAFFPGLKPGDLAASPLNPLV